MKEKATLEITPHELCLIFGAFTATMKVECLPESGKLDLKQFIERAMLALEIDSDALFSVWAKMAEPVFNTPSPENVVGLPDED